MDRDRSGHDRPPLTAARFADGSTAGSISIGDRKFGITKSTAVAISPWEPHNFEVSPCGQNHFVLTLYIKPMWFLENSQSAEFALSFGTPQIQITPTIEMWVGRLTSILLDDQPSDRFDGFLFETTRQCFDQSWRDVGAQPLLSNVQRKFNDFRVRRSLRVMQETYSDETQMDELAREVGLSRPHFFKLFKMQMGITPNLYLNTLRAEHAIDELMTTRKSVTDIGLDLGFAVRRASRASSAPMSVFRRPTIAASRTSSDGVKAIQRHPIRLSDTPARAAKS
ncbi:MAG: AraC family transcriptional regulator, partial [Pseudomonadota bacterium]